MKSICTLANATEWDPETAVAAYASDSIGVFAYANGVKVRQRGDFLPPAASQGPQRMMEWRRRLYVEEGPPTSADVTHRQGEF